MTENVSSDTLRDRVNWHVDGLTLPCARCGSDVAYDAVVEDEAWQENAPETVQNDVLCLPCLDEEANGIPLESLRVVYWTGQNGTVPLVPAADAIEYAAQLEDQVEYVRETLQWTLDEYKQLANEWAGFRRERDEARAERDQLHDALAEINQHVEGMEYPNTEYVGREAKEALRLVERGDTVGKIRREARKEGAKAMVENIYERLCGNKPDMAGWISRHVRVEDALAEADDQEDEKNA